MSKSDQMLERVFALMERDSLEDLRANGTELTRMDGTMNDIYGDGSDHQACPKCGLCITCGDCDELGCGSDG